MDVLSGVLLGAGLVVLGKFAVDVVRDLIESAGERRADQARCSSWSPAPGEDDLPVRCDRRAGHAGCHMGSRDGGAVAWGAER